MASAASQSPAQAVKISDLTVQQTAELKQTIDQELSFLQQQYEALVDARQRFETSRKTMTELSQSCGDQPEILVPMTQSVYQPGKLVCKNRFVVELGAGYYVERSLEANDKYLAKRLESIGGKLEEVSKTVAEKKKIAEIVTFNLQTKVAAMQRQVPAPEEADS